MVFWVYSGDWNAGGWVVAILLAILVVAILAALVWLIVWGLLRLIRRFRKPVINQDLLDEIHNLKKQIVKLTREKDRILSMKVHAVGDEEALAALEEGEEGAAAEGEEKKQTLRRAVSGSITNRASYVFSGRACRRRGF